MKTIRAIEIGYGTTSISVSNSGGDIETFPSIVINTDKTSEETLGFGQTDAIKVQLSNGSTCLVGSLNEDNQENVRELNSQYIDTEQYEALMLAALSKLDVDHVDLLIGGLPVNNMALKTKLEQKMKGTHKVNGRTITVADASVFAQPLGLLVDYLDSLGDKTEEAMSERVLAIDCGFLTVDFVVAQNLQPSATANGAVNLGMSKILQSCQEALSKTFDQPPSIQIIDNAFRSDNGFIKVYGKKLPFPLCQKKDINDMTVPFQFDCSDSIKKTTDSAISFIANKIGGGHDIDKIIVGGGAGPRYIDAIKRKFPLHSVTLVSDHLISVCRGLHILGLYKSDIA